MTRLTDSTPACVLLATLLLLGLALALVVGQSRTTVGACDGLDRAETAICEEGR